MKARLAGLLRARRNGVSEVVGTLFLLVMTVAFFSLIMLWVYGFDNPEGEAYVNLFPGMERIDSQNANVTIIHRGGETLTGNSVDIRISVQNESFGTLLGPYNYQNGSGGEEKWSVGGTWAMVFSTVPEDAFVELSVYDTSRQAVLLRTELQRGYRVGADAPPILGVPVVLPDDQVYADGSDKFYLQAVAVDYNGDLPDNGVRADLTPIWSGLGNVVLEYKGFDTYRSGWVTVPAAATPGKKTIEVTATDGKGYTDTNYATITIKTSSDNQPPIVTIVSPTSAEIAAGRIQQIAATYTDPSGVDISTVELYVWENGVPLDTSTKTVSELLTSYTPLTGFQESSLYHVNVSIEDTEGLRGYAEMIFRVSSYSQPGNPRGETAFDVMNKQWVSTTVFEHDDYIRIQLWSAIIPRMDDSELRLTKTDSSNIYMFKDRFEPNLTIPPSGSNPWYIYDATIDIKTDGSYGGPIAPGFYCLQMQVRYYDNNVNYINQIFVTIKYEDGSLPDTGGFMTFNTTGKWSSPTVYFDHNEHIYIQIVTAENLEWEKWTGTPPVHYICTINRAIVTIKEVYGDNILYTEIPRYHITYAGTGLGGHIYRMAVDLNDTIGGGHFFSSSNWYPIEVSVETQIQHIKFKRIWTTYDIAFQAGDQIRINRPCDIGLAKNDVIIYHEDDTTTEMNKTVIFGETLFIYIKVWNYGEVDITNAKVQVWAISKGVALDYWELTSDDNFNDPNDNDKLDAVSPGNDFVWTILTWNTSRTGYDQSTLENASMKVSVSILTPLKGGYGSDPILESEYDNNEVIRGLLEDSDGDLKIEDTGYASPSEVDVGILEILMDRLYFTASDGNVHIVGINVTLTGTAQDSDVTRVALYQDVNLNSRVDYEDRLAAEGTFVGGVWRAAENWVLYDGYSMQYLLIFDISDAAVSGRTLGTSIAVIDDVYVEEPGNIIDPAFPYASGIATISSNQNDLDGSGSGPAAAFRDSYLVYTLDLTAYNRNNGKKFEGALTITGLRMDVTGWANVTDIWLLDDTGEVIQYAIPAATVTFSGLKYTITAATGRTIYVAMNVMADAAPGEVIGIDIDRTDVTLSSTQDRVLNTFGITLTTVVQMMSDYFEYKVGNPVLEPTFWDALYGMNIGSTDSSVDIYTYGITVSWDDPDKPQWVSRIYIDGQLVFEATGVTHQGNGQLLYFTSPIKLTNTDMSFRIEFNDQVIHKQWGMGNKWNDNNIYFDWAFWDESETNGGKYVEIKGGPHYNVSWTNY
jgi:hypothetical protein